MAKFTEGSLYARAAAHQSWANTPDRTARTEKARAAAMAKFERQVDPDGVLPVQERRQRAESARKAYFLMLAAKSAVARRTHSGRRRGRAPSDVETKGETRPGP